MKCTPLLLNEHEKTAVSLWKLLFRKWQGQKDSNPQQRFWRPTCYHYTMPLSGTNGIISVLIYFVKHFLQSYQIYDIITLK